MIKEKRSIFISYIVLIGIIVTFILVWQAHRIGKQIQKIEPVSEIVPEIKKEEIATRLIPSRPEDYGMVVTRESDKPKTQAEWDKFFHRKLSEVKSQISLETLAKIKNKIEEDPAKREEKMEKIDKSFQQCQELLKKDPDNEEVKEKLERLMMLKSIAKELP